MLMREVSKMRSRYAKLSEQLDVTRKRIDERQVTARRVDGTPS